MTFEATIAAWLPLVGGVSGLLMLCYAGLMLYYNSRKAREIAELRRELGELRGMLLIIAGQMQGRRR